MIRSIFAFTVCVLFVSFTTGCGGGSSSSATTPINGNTPNPLAGKYIGPFTTSAGQSGTAYFDINTSGAVTGTVLNTTSTTVASASSIIGTISNTGVISISVAGGAATTGTLSVNSSSQLTGTLTQSTTTYTVTLADTTTGNAPVYAGLIKGTYTSNLGDVGTINIVTDGNGNANALFYDTTSKTVSLLTGTITDLGGLDLAPFGGGGVTVGTLAIGTKNAVTGTLGSAVQTIMVTGTLS